MSKHPIISVILVNWNGLKWLDKCIGSLMIQDYNALEIIMVDNGSTDKSVTFVKKEFPTVQVIQNKKNLGFASAVNIGIDHSSGEFILLLNTDAWCDKKVVRQLFDCLVKLQLDVVGAQEADYKGVTRPTYTTTIDMFGHPIYLYERGKQNFFLSGVCILFSKELYVATGGLDSDFFMYFEEIDWFWRLNLVHKKIAFAEGVYVNHAGAGSSGSGIKQKAFLWRNENTLQMLIKNYSATRLCWILPLYLIINTFEALVFFVILRWDIAITYPKGWLFNVKHFQNIWRKHKEVQDLRKVSDRKIKSLMYPGVAKVSHAVHFVKSRQKVKSKVMG